MRFNSLSSVFKQLYKDQLTNYRHKSSVNDDGTTGSALEENPVHAAVQCRISFKKPDDSVSNREDRNPINLGIKIFCDTTVDVKKGDVIVAKKLDDDGNVLATYTGIANMPYVYPSHQEIEITNEGDA